MEGRRESRRMGKLVMGLVLQFHVPSPESLGISVTFSGALWLMMYVVKQ